MEISRLASRFGKNKNEFLVRADGRIEWACEHGIGHTVWAPESQGKAGYVHGCDGCCSRLKDVFPKYKKIYQLGREENKDIFIDGNDIIHIQEKVDGGNFRFYINKDGKLIVGSRNQQLTSNEGDETNVQKSFVRCLKHIKKKLEGKDLSKYKGLIFYGECMIKHTIGYNWDEVPPFLGFDILDTETGLFVSQEGMYGTYHNLGLDIVPLIKSIKASDIKQITDKDVPKSKYYGGQAEGIVFKNSSKQIYAKYVREQFKEKNKEEFGHSKKQATTDEDYFTAIYCTNARIEKVIWKLIDEGDKLELSLMPKLIKAIYKDIWEENWGEISTTKQKTINFDKLKKSFTRRCFKVLNNIITNNAIINKEDSK